MGPSFCVNYSYGSILVRFLIELVLGREIRWRQRAERDTWEAWGAWIGRAGRDREGSMGS